MAETVRVELLKKLYRNNVGDVIDVRSHEARALIAVGTAKQYVESRRRQPVVTRVMEPEPTVTTEPATPPTQPEVTQTAETGTIETTEAGFGREPYARRDMKPED